MRECDSIQSNGCEKLSPSTTILQLTADAKLYQKRRPYAKGVTVYDSHNDDYYHDDYYSDDYFYHPQYLPLSAKGKGKGKGQLSCPDGMELVEDEHDNAYFHLLAKGNKGKGKGALRCFSIQIEGSDRPGSLDAKSHTKFSP